MDLPIPTKVLLDRYDIVMAAFCFPVFFFFMPNCIYYTFCCASFLFIQLAIHTMEFWSLWFNKDITIFKWSFVRMVYNLLLFSKF